MNRKQRIQKYFDKSDQLTVKNKTYQKALIELFQWLIKTDRTRRDTTTGALDLTSNTTATISAKQRGMVAGLEEIAFLIKTFLPQLTIKHHIQDGLRITYHVSLITISGPATTILPYERTILNILGRMSGIATQTNALVQKTGNTPFIAATRKTPWNLLDKKAVAVGGGLTHRLTLFDEIMIKDNHLKALQKENNLASTEKAIEHALKTLISKKKRYFELEVENPSQAETVIHALSRYTIYDIRYTTLLLDNWKPDTVKQFINKVKKTAIYNRILFEASGDITPETITTWAETNVDIVSLGFLTHSCNNFNLSMNII